MPSAEAMKYVAEKMYPPYSENWQGFAVANAYDAGAYAAQCTKDFVDAMNKASAYDRLISRLRGEVEHNERREKTCHELMDGYKHEDHQIDWTRCAAKAVAYRTVADDLRTVLREFGVDSE